MTVPTVPLVEWKSLYELASRVRQNEPWRTLTDTDLFALEDPMTKQVGRSQELQEFRSCRSSGEKNAAARQMLGRGLIDRSREVTSRRRRAGTASHSHLIYTTYSKLLLWCTALFCLGQIRAPPELLQLLQLLTWHAGWTSAETFD